MSTNKSPPPLIAVVEYPLSSTKLGDPPSMPKNVNKKKRDGFFTFPIK